MPTIPTMSLKAAGFTPAAFTPTTYQLQTPDPTLLARSMQIQEGREQNSRAGMDSIDTALMTTRQQLDVSEHDWIDEKADAIRDRIDTQIALGNYQSAIRLAQNEARDFKRDKDVQNKIIVNQLRQQERQRINSMHLDPMTKLRWEAENPYVYNGTADWKAAWNPVEDVDLNTLLRLAEGMTAPDSGSDSWHKQGETLMDFEGNQIDFTGKTKEQAAELMKNAAGSFASESRSGSYGFNRKTAADMEKTWKDLLAEPKYRMALKQKFETTIWAYKDALAKANNIELSDREREQALRDAEAYKSELRDDNGFLYHEDSFETWMTNKVVPMFKNMEYNNIQTSRGEGINYGNGLYGKNKQRQDNNDAKVSEALEEEVGVQGTPIRTTYVSNEPAYNSDQFGIYFNESDNHYPYRPKSNN